MENQTNLVKEPASQTSVLTPQHLLEHWQGHRRLTRKVIAAFPEDKIFEYSIGGMRVFSEMILEIIRLSAIGISGIITGEWKKLDEVLNHSNSGLPKTKDELLRLWDEVTGHIETNWPKIQINRFEEIVVFMGQYKSPVYAGIFYLIDNEIHHRGEGYVYLRSLGIEPPAFYDRG